MAREIIYPTFVFVLIASVWALGWEKSHTDRLEEFRPRVSHYYDDEPGYESQSDGTAPAAITSVFDPADD